MGKASQQGGHNLNSLLQSFHEPQMTSQQLASQPPPQPQSHPSRLTQMYAAGAVGSPGATHTTDQPSLAQMTPLERFGLPGLFAALKSENADTNLAHGQELTALGLNLNSPE